MRTYELPEGHHTVTPALAVPGIPKVIEFLERAFGAEAVDRYDMPDGSVAHAEVKIRDSVVMMGEPMGDMKPMPAMLNVYVDSGDEVDATYRKALDAGAESVDEPKDQFYGYRSARVRDPAGNQWSIAAIVEELSKEEIERRMKDMGM